MAKTMCFEDKTHVQATLILPKNFKPLKSREEEKINERRKKKHTARSIHERMQKFHVSIEN